MEWIQQENMHDYRLVPSEFPISDNDRRATYDQFMSLRDTLVYSNKFYGNNAGRSLIIGMKTDGNPTNTIEIWEPNIATVKFDNDWTTPEIVGKYTKEWTHWWISCEIVTGWRYVLQHKEQFNNIDSSITRIHTYILQHKVDWTTQPRAVFDWEWDTPWEIKRLTAFGYVECDLEKWDWLELIMLDQNDDPIPTSELQADSNWMMAEYKDLAYN